MDVVVTVPKAQWSAWLAEGDLPGDSPRYESHFWIPAFNLPDVRPGELVYIVAHGRLRGFAPLIRIEHSCTLNPRRACLVRAGDAQAVTIPAPVRGFQGWRYRWWRREEETLFPNWQTEGVA